MLRLLVATTNAGKLRDFALAAAECALRDNDEQAVHISSMPGLDAIAAPEEDEETFEGNARLKAVYYSRFALGEIVIADDSGLEVDALGGAPGVRSARYAEDAGFLTGTNLPVDERNNRCLLAALRGVPESGRRARYQCVLAAAKNGEVLATGVGTVEGKIQDSARGDGGFGYDPYFIPEGMRESMAEMAATERMKLSHRGRALRNLLPKLHGAALDSTR